MIADIATDANRLHVIIENLLQLTRLGSGTRADLEPQLLDRIIERELESFRARNRGRVIELVGLRPDLDTRRSSRPTRRCSGCCSRTSSATRSSTARPADAIEVAIDVAGDAVEVRILDRGHRLRRGRRASGCSSRSTDPSRRVARPTAWASGSPSAGGSSTSSAAGSGPCHATAAAPWWRSPCRSRATPASRAPDRSGGPGQPPVGQRPAGRVDRRRVPVGTGRREDVDHDRALRADADVVRHVGRDPPRPARPHPARLVADRERHVAGDDHPELLVLVAVLGHDRIRRELDEGEGDPLALDPPGAHGLAPHVDDGHRRRRR